MLLLPPFYHAENVLLDSITSMYRRVYLSVSNLLSLSVTAARTPLTHARLCIALMFLFSFVEVCVLLLFFVFIVNLSFFPHLFLIFPTSHLFIDDQIYMCVRVCVCVLRALLLSLPPCKLQRSSNAPPAALSLTDDGAGEQK